MKISVAQIFLLAAGLPFACAMVEKGSTSSTCGGSAFQLRASGVPSDNRFSFVNGAYIDVTNFGEPVQYNVSSFMNGMGTSFRLNSACRLVAQLPKKLTAQIFPGAADKDEPLYFQNGAPPINGQTPELAVCHIVKKTKKLNCPKAGADSGLEFYVVTGTQFQGMYEIGQPLLALANKSVVDGNYTAVTLTAVQSGA